MTPNIEAIKKQAYLEVLTKRLAWLDHRITEIADHQRSRFDLREREALAWAITELSKDRPS